LADIHLAPEALVGGVAGRAEVDVDHLRAGAVVELQHVGPDEAAGARDDHALAGLDQAAEALPGGRGELAAVVFLGLVVAAHGPSFAAYPAAPDSTTRKP